MKKILVRFKDTGLTSCYDVVPDKDAKKSVVEWDQFFSGNNMFPDVFLEDCSEEEGVEFKEKLTKFYNTEFSDIPKALKAFRPSLVLRK